MRGTRSDDLDDNNGQLDDNKLIKLFDAEFKRLPESSDPTMRSRFAETLLRCKFVLDNFVLKREFTATNGEDGAWSLKRLVRGESVKARSGRTQVSARFPNCVRPRQGRVGRHTNRRHDTRGSAPSVHAAGDLHVPRTMHWITALLRLPLLDMTRTEAAAAIMTTLRDYARTKVQQAFFVAKSPSGFDIERVVFTYLDYLLAEQDDRSLHVPLSELDRALLSAVRRSRARELGSARPG